ncbi:hypothetical protein QTP88_021280 [Uroleucon formosanum]
MNIRYRCIVFSVFTNSLLLFSHTLPRKYKLLVQNKQLFPNYMILFLLASDKIACLFARLFNKFPLQTLLNLLISHVTLYILDSIYSRESKIVAVID